MWCSRCGSNVPEFLWQGNDHPVILENSTMIFNMEPANPADNTVKFSVTGRVGVLPCSEVFPKLETLEVNGQECVVIHLLETSRKPYLSVCRKKMVKFPEENDKRPVTLCEACRKLALS